MNKRLTILALYTVLMLHNGWAQKPIASGGVRQCSAIREIVYGASQPKYGLLLDAALRSSHGYQTMGSWRFETERFKTTLEWPGATQCFIEHSWQSTDSTMDDNWQYIAEFEAVADPLYASRAMQDILVQMQGCQWPLNDSLIIRLAPVDPSELPPSMPDGLADAYLFALPTEGNKQITIMLGLEKRRQGYRSVLMVEALYNEGPSPQPK